MSFTPFLTHSPQQFQPPAGRLLAGAAALVRQPWGTTTNAAQPLKDQRHCQTKIIARQTTAHPASKVVKRIQRVTMWRRLNQTSGREPEN